MPTFIPMRSASKRRNSGLTLIELMVAMAIVGIIFAASATALKTAFDVNLKSTAGKLASTLRYLSNKAVTDHLYLRVVYDLEGQSYRVEESKEPLVISTEEEEEPEAKPEGEGEEEKPPLTPSESKLLKPVKLKSDVLFKDVQLSYLKTKKETGEAYTYFFPDGYATPTIINFRDKEDEDHFSVELFPLSGRVQVTNEYKESFTEEKKNP